MLEIVTQIRTHLELQRTLGVNFVDTDPGPEQAPAHPNFEKQTENRKSPEIPATPASPKNPLVALQEELAGCSGCCLSRNRSQIVFGEGSERASVVFIGTAPGEQEERQGSPFAGETGQLLTDIIVKGMKVRREQVYVCTFLKCRMPDDRDPDSGESEMCERFLIRQLDAIKPKVIVALGKAARLMLKTETDISALRGKWHQYHGIQLIPTFDPAHLLAHPGDKKAAWEDIKKVITEMDRLEKGWKQQKN